MDTQENMNYNNILSTSNNNPKTPLFNSNIAYISFIEEIDFLLRTLDYKNIDLLKASFPSYYQDYNNIIQNIIKTSQSDIIINFGINNYISKLFIEDLLIVNEKKLLNFEIEKVYLNANIHSSEDYILKKICKALELSPERNGFDKAREEIEDYYKNYKKDRKTKFLVIIFENIEHLFFKKKQTLFYTLLEIVNISSNLLFCGITSNFNIMDLMEKRVRSRFSQKTININLKEEELFFFALEDIFYTLADKNKLPENNPFIDNEIDNLKNPDGINENIPFNNFLNNIRNENDKSKSNRNKNRNLMDVLDSDELENKVNSEIFTKSSNFFNNQNLLKFFYKEILKKNNELSTLIKNKIEMGCGIKEIVTQLKYLLTIFLIKITDSSKEQLFISTEDINNNLNQSLAQYFEETESTYKNMLMNFPKLHITILVCLCRCVNIHREKITIGMIYQEYLKYLGVSQMKTTLDILIIKKILEELANSNMIYIKSDEKYLSLYELKLPYYETVDIIKGLNFKKIKNMDSSLQGFLEFKSG